MLLLTGLRVVCSVVAAARVLLGCTAFVWVTVCWRLVGLRLLFYCYGFNAAVLGITLLI